MSVIQLERETPTGIDKDGNLGLSSETEQVRGMSYDDLEKEVVRSTFYSDLQTFIDENLQRQGISPSVPSLEHFILFDIQSNRRRSFAFEVRDRIRAQVAVGEPIHFAVIAIAHKNPNPEVCGGRILPDLAEVKFLLHLKDILDGVGEVYQPGATFTILTEGGFYLEPDPIFDVTPEVVEQYEKGVMQIAETVGRGRIALVSLKDIVSTAPQFEQRYTAILKEITEREYGPYVPVMERSITPQQSERGVTAVDMARKYAARHKAKHVSNRNGKSSVYGYLEELLGQNYIYCSVTGSQRPEVLNIDPYPNNKPATLPQHGLGVLRGGTDRLDVTAFVDIREQIQRVRFGSFVVGSYDTKPIGYINFGARRKDI